MDLLQAGSPAAYNLIIRRYCGQEVVRLNEERDDQMAVNKEQQPQTETAPDKAAMEAAQAVMKQYEKTFEKLAKN